MSVVILPTKHLEPERSLLGVAADCLAVLDGPMTVSSLWDAFKQRRTGSWKGSGAETFDWFVLALDLLFAIGAIAFADGLVSRTTR